MLKIRLRAAALCALLMLSPLEAVAAPAKKAAPRALTSSVSVRTEEGIQLTGERAVVDFAWLTTVNDQCVGWLYQEETGFSYPVLRGKDDGQQHKRGFDGTNVGLKGLPYLDPYASPAMDEDAFVIFGSGREGGALESLNQYQQQAYYEAHPSLRLLTPDGDWQADVFGCIKTVEANLHKWRKHQKDETFEAWLQRVERASSIRALPDCVPQEGERIAVFTTINSGNNRRMIFTVLRPIAYQTEVDVNLNQTELDSLPTISGRVQVGTLGEKMVYAQNDPLWSQMRYESERTNKFRRFGGGGCGPTAVAIAIANLVDVEELPKLREYSLDGLGTLLCSCSVNRVYCNHLHAPYQLDDPEAYLRYLPVIVADFAAGNNRWEINSRPGNSQGSNMRFLEPLCQVFGLRYTPVEQVAEALDMLAASGNNGLLVCCALRGGPFTTTSHYVVIVGVDDTYFYVLDPLYRDDYSATDRKHVIEAILAPGVVKIRLDNVRKSGLSIVAYLQRETETAQAE